MLRGYVRHGEAVIPQMGYVGSFFVIAVCFVWLYVFSASRSCTSGRSGLCCSGFLGLDISS